MATKDLALAPTVSHKRKDEIIDWEKYRRLSLCPGGFGPSRVDIWPRLLNASIQYSTHTSEDERDSASEEHRDERQIGLDTDRSFVVYPVDLLSSGRRQVMQEKLNRLLVTIFRRHPKLNYFQGYHDIISVLVLTLPDELQLVCAEKISLHRVRDSMGSTLEPILGLLRVTKNLLRLADLKYAQNLERSSPLPFYALSNLLTLFSHDMPTLPLIQHVFDYILCRPPIIIVYLATAIILSRKDEIQRLEEDDEDEGMGMAHSVLSGLPQLSDELEQASFDTKVKEPSVDDYDGTTCVDEEGESRIDTESEPSEDTVVQVEENSENGETTTTASVGLVKVCDTELSTDGPDENASPSCQQPSRTPSPIPIRVHKSTFITLSFLLTHADELYTLYPPTHPELSLSNIMGPQSVVNTWSESPAALPTDQEAEAMINRPELVVYPYIEDEVASEDDEASESEKSGSRLSRRKRKKGGKLRERVKGKLGRLRRLKPERRTGTMVAGAVLVLGVAIAVYGVKARGVPSGAKIPGADGHGRDLKKIAGWIGGALVGATERVFSRSSSSGHLHD